MKILNILLLGLSFLCGSSAYLASQQIPFISKGSVRCGHRNLIIIQDHYTENNKTLSPCTIVLLRGLQAEIAPIIVSASVWYNACLYLENHGNEHFLKPKLKNWDVYKVDDNVCLAVPRPYQEAIEAFCSKSGWIREIISLANHWNPHDILIGIKLSTLKKIENPFECSFSRSAHNTFGKVGSFFAGAKSDISCESLKLVLITKEDLPTLKNYPLTDIFLIGHGACQEKKKTRQIMIAGFSLEEFRSLLSFLHESLHTRLLIYQTCYGGGKLLDIPYKTHGKPDIYNFDIISCCTTNSPASIIYDPFSENNLDFQKIFKKIDDSCKDPIEQRVASYFPGKCDSVRKRVIENIPYARLAGTGEFFICRDDSDHQSSVEVYDGRSKNIKLTDKQVFITTGNMPKACIDIKGCCCAIIEKDGGNLTIKRLNAADYTLNDLVLYCFCPVTMPSVSPSTVYIKELICKKSKKDPKKVILKNVTISSYRTSHKRLPESCELSINGNSLRPFALRKKITFEEDDQVYSQLFKPRKKSGSGEIFSFIWPISGVAQAGVGASMGNPLSFVSLSTNLVSLVNGGVSRSFSIKHKKNWNISKPKLLSSKERKNYIQQFDFQFYSLN